MAVSDRKVFLAGCGSIGKRHAECLYDIGVRSFLFYDPDPARSRALADQYHGETVPTYEDGLSSDADAVYILSPTKLHVAQAKQAVLAGKNIFLEKPLSDSPDGIDELQRLIDEKGVTVEVGFCFRFHDGIAKMKKLLSDGEIGKLVSVRAMMGEHFPDVRPDYLSTYYVKYSGTFELVHDLDLALYFAGKEPVDFTGFCGSYSGLGFESPDTAEIVMKFDDAVANVHLDFFQSPRTRTMTLLGTEGQMVLDFSTWDRCTLRIYRRSTGSWERFDMTTARNDMFRAESRNFFAACGGEEPNLVPVSEAVKSLKIVQSVIKANHFR